MTLRTAQRSWGQQIRIGVMRRFALGDGREVPLPRARWFSSLQRVGVGGFMLIAAAACGRPFEVKTPQELVELPGHEQAHEYRATSPDGVVVAARAIDTEGRGDLAFWERAVTVKLRDQEGYALLEVRDVQSEDGTPGRQLRFGRDEEQRTYSYWVTLFVAQQRLFVMEAGGEGAAVDQYAQSLDWQVAHFEVRCQSWLAPVLASRTCNRW